MDIVALNLQRGRDHGIPSYNNYRSFCGEEPIRDYQQLRDMRPRPIGRRKIDRLESVYPDVNDVDLFAGALMEPRAPNGLLGSTLSCLIAENFAHLKKSDRFFYENGDQPHSFTQGTHYRSAGKSCHPLKEVRLPL